MKTTTALLAAILTAASIMFFAPMTVHSEDIDVRTVQEALRQLGYDPGPRDGIPGEKTSQAIAAFQKDFHLPVTGHYDADIASVILNTYRSKHGGKLPTLPKENTRRETGRAAQAANACELDDIAIELSRTSESSRDITLIGVVTNHCKETIQVKVRAIAFDRQERQLAEATKWVEQWYPEREVASIAPKGFLKFSITVGEFDTEKAASFSVNAVEIRSPHQNTPASQSH